MLFRSRPGEEADFSIEIHHGSRLLTSAATLFGLNSFRSRFRPRCRKELDQIGASGDFWN